MPVDSCTAASAIARATAGSVGKASSLDASLTAPGTLRPGAYAGCVSSADRIRTVIPTSTLRRATSITAVYVPNRRATESDWHTCSPVVCVLDIYRQDAAPE